MVLPPVPSPAGMWAGGVFNRMPSTLSIFSESTCHLVTTLQDSTAAQFVPQYIRRSLTRHKVPILVLMPKSVVLLPDQPEQFMAPAISKDRSAWKRSGCKLTAHQ